ncbi:polysaccharide lyase family 7 protein [Gayadomonas joobiniege]|uniref:polysaccharide lyase family 7 protein n=1 Tax=Gayadomonas joobiniege TaxID=1234606 RepID=UPI0003721278|nr:polysaccharide lyase family 7 protein [Gayadomonas joobiniege]
MIKLNSLSLVCAIALVNSVQAAEINVQSAEDWGNGHSSYPASNVLDNSLDWSSRWAASGSPVNLQLNIGSIKSVSKVGISWGKGGEQTHEFEIWARAATSGSWTKVYDGYSSGDSASIEVYDITDIDAQQVRVKTFGNSAGSDWTNIKEVKLYDESGDGGLAINTAFDDGSGHGSYPATNVIDNNTNWSSRWAGSGSPVNLTIELNQTSSVTDLGIAWGQGDSRAYTFEVYARPGTSGSWTKVFDDVSSGTTADIETFDITDIDAQQIRIKTFSNTAGSSWTNITEVKVYGNKDPSNDDPIDGLDPNKAPSENFNLSQWYLSVPSDDDNSGTADSIKEDALNAGYENSDYFYTGSDGGMVFVCPIGGYKTSTNTSYTRTELREMLRAGDTSISTKGVNGNNWVFSSAPSSAQNSAGGVDGTLKATLAVNHVTTTGDSSQVGRVIIGQIHAENNEPIRLYYRKLPGNSKGSIYFAHEEADSDELWYEMIGSRSSSASNPSDGIALNEVFSYEINVTGNLLTVKIMRDGKSTITETHDMSNSGYDDASDWMYFKAGVYNQNNTGNNSDYVQATFYKLEQSHN